MENTNNEQAAFETVRSSSESPDSIRQSLFVGRTDVLSRILSNLKNNQSVWIYGEHGIGKTSILIMLQTQAQSQLGSEVRVLSLPVLENENEFLGSLARFIGLEETAELETIERTLREQKVLILWDEFDLAAGSEGFSPAFFLRLRSLIQTTKLQVVIASEKAYMETKSLGSPLSNLFTLIHLDVLTKAESQEILRNTFLLIDSSIDESNLEKAFELTQGQPRKLMMIGGALVQNNQDWDKALLEYQGHHPTDLNSNFQSSQFHDLLSALSPSSRQAVQIAENLRLQIKNPDGDRIFTEMILIGLNEKAKGPTSAMLVAFGIDRDSLLAGFAAMRNWEFPSNLSLDSTPIENDGKTGLPLSANTIRTLERAYQIAKEKKSNQIRSRHILIALLENADSMAYEWLDTVGIPIDQVRTTLFRVPESQMITPSMFAYAAGVASADRTADKDTLGFTPYTQALAEIIIKKETVPPVVFGIYGPWGSGKSTFMSFVRKYLEKWDKEHHQVKENNRLIRFFKRVLHLQKRDEVTADQAEGNMPRIVCVRFDAWAYTDSAKLWVGLVRAISEKIDGQIRWWQRPFYWIGRGGWKFLGAIFLSLLPVIFGIALVLATPFWNWTQNSEIVRNSVSIFSAAVGFLGSIKLFDMQKPLSSIIDTQIQRLDKTEIEGVTNRIQNELHKTISDYFELAEDKPLNEEEARSKIKRQKKFKLVVLIDELDRCPMEKIVDILESIKLFLAEDVFIVLMAVDARVGAEAIRLHYKDVKNPDLAREYLEKIIQVPIPVPSADHANLSLYVDSLMMVRIPPPEKIIGVPKTNFPSPKPQLLPVRATLPITEEPFKPYNLEDSKNEKQTIIDFSKKYLDSNPRRIKRLLNTYRYVKILATRRGVRTDTSDWQNKMILWLGITMKWPLFMEEAIKCAITSSVAGSEFWDQIRNVVEAEYCPPSDMFAEFPLKATELKTFYDLADNFIRENPPMAVLRNNGDRQRKNGE